MQAVAGVFTSNSARIRQASIRQNPFQILFQVVGAKVSKLKSKSRIHTDPFDFSAISLSLHFPAPTTIFQTSIRVETHSKNGFYSAVSKAVPIPRRAGKRFELGGILKPQRTEYTPTGTRKFPRRNLRQFSGDRRRTKRPRQKTNRARFPAARNRKKSEKVIDKLTPQWETDNFKIGDYCSVAQR